MARKQRALPEPAEIGGARDDLDALVEEAIDVARREGVEGLKKRFGEDMGRRLKATMFTPDLVKIEAMLKAHEKVPGAELQCGTELVITRPGEEPPAKDDSEQRALAFLHGFAVSDTGHDFKFLRPGSPEEARARGALVGLLRDLDQPLPAALRWTLANLFGEKPRSGVPRRLVFRAWGEKRQPHEVRDRKIAFFVCLQLRTGQSMKRAVLDAQQRFGGSRDYVYRVWKKWGKKAQEDVARAVARGDDPASIIW
jgi:hypothetical protein